MAFSVYVTLIGIDGNEDSDFLDLYMERTFDTFEEAERFYEHLLVKPWGTIALAAHHRHPDLAQIEADYDLVEVDHKGQPVNDSMRHYINEAIWWEE